MLAISKAAAEVGLSTDRIQQFQQASGALGLEANVLTLAMSRLEISVGRAGTSAGHQSKALETLGVKAKDAYGKVRPLDELFLDVADALSKETDQNKRAMLTLDLFGRGGHTLLPFLRQGRDGINELVKAFAKLNGGYSKRAIELAKEYSIELMKNKVSLQGLVSSLWEQAEPALRATAEKVTVFTQWLRQMTERSEAGKAALYVFSAAVAAAGVALLVAFPQVGLITAALGALFLVIDEILVTLEGGDSIIRRAMDGLYGEGYTAAKVRELKDDYKDIAAFLKEAWGYWQKLTGQTEKEFGPQDKEFGDQGPPLPIGFAGREQEKRSWLDSLFGFNGSQGLRPDENGSMWASAGGVASTFLPPRAGMGPDDRVPGGALFNMPQYKATNMPASDGPDAVSGKGAINVQEMHVHITSKDDPRKDGQSFVEGAKAAMTDLQRKTQ